MTAHLGTTITAVFAVIDAAGDVAVRQPMQVEVREFSEAAFAEAFQKLDEARRAFAATQQEAAEDDTKRL